MKKILRNILCLTLIYVLLVIFPVTAAEEMLFPQNYKLILCESSMTGIAGGEHSVLSTTPYTNNKTLMVPVRYVFENLGYTVSWDNGKVVLSGNKTIEIVQGSNEITIDGEKIALLEKAENKNGTLMIGEDILEELSFNYKKSKSGLFVVYDGKYSPEYESNLLKLQGIYVSPNGATTGAATPDKPLKNIELAVELAKNHLATYGEKYPVNVYVKGGIYRIKNTIKFDSAYFSDDSKKGVHFKGYDGEAVFTGSTELDENLLKPVKDAFTLSRIPKKARGRVAYIDLKEVGLADKFSTSQSGFPYIFVNDVMQIQARWPNNDWALNSGVPMSLHFTVAEDNVRNWGTVTEARVKAFGQVNYELLNMKVTSVNPETKTVGLEKKGFSSSNKRYYIYNLLEELDMPGEWFVDREAGILYFYPPYNMSDVKFEICTLMENMIDISSCKNISFDKITFEKSGRMGIVMSHASKISITNCKFQFIQNIGISSYVSDYTDICPVNEVVIDGNEVYMLGQSFIDIRTGDINTLKDGKSRITNNRIMNLGYSKAYTSIIYLGRNGSTRNASCGVLVANNLIQDSDMFSGINPAGIDILTTQNELLNIGTSHDDAGAIYIGRAAGLYNTEITQNYVHHLNKNRSYPTLYNDDGYAGSYWHHNVVYDASQMFIIGAGMDIRAEHNLGINLNKAAGIGNRMNGDASVYGPDGAMYNELKETLGTYPIQAIRFPEFTEALQRTPFFAPWNSRVYGNVGINNSGLAACNGSAAVISQFETYGAKYTTDSEGNKIDITGKNATVEGNPNYPYSDDIFVDAKNQNWNIKPDSEFAKKYPEFLKIDIEKIGISDEYKHLLNLSKDFKLRAPFNGETQLQPKEITFSWDPVKGASKYRLVVATDPELKNVVYDKTQDALMNSNSCTLTNLTLDTVYYWKVYAIGLARQDLFEVGSMGAPYSFKTAAKNEVNRENLKLAIDALKSVFNEIKEGGYEYEDEFFIRANEILEKAEEIHSRSTDQDERDKMEDEIYDIIDISPYYMIVSFKNPDFLYNPDSVWTFNKSHGLVSYNGTEVTISSTEAPSELKRLEAYVKDDTSVNNILCMQVNIESLPADDDSAYMGYAFKVNPTRRSQEYQLFVFKERITEFQKKGMCIEMPNFNANKAGEWIDVELGSVKCPGGVLTFAALNGKVIWAGLDRTTTPVVNGGRFEVWKNYNDTKMRPMEKVPEKSSLIKRVYENFENPDCEDHLEAMLIGMGTLIGMNNPLYNVLDKEKLSKRLYPKIEGGKVKIENNDITNYKDTVWKTAILEGYNNNHYEFVLKNKVEHVYNDYIQLEKLDEDGRCFKKIMDRDFLDNYIAMVNEKAMGGDCNNFEELRKRYAEAIFTIAINGCSTGIYGFDTHYMKELITKANADYLGINIDAYFTLDESGRDKVNSYIGRNDVSFDRSLEEIVEEINTMAVSLQ